MYTGKIIVNLHAKYVSIEKIHTHRITGGIKKDICQEDLLDNEAYLQELIERLSVYSISHNVQLFQLIYFHQKVHMIKKKNLKY